MMLAALDVHETIVGKGHDAPDALVLARPSDVTDERLHLCLGARFAVHQPGGVLTDPDVEDLSAVDPHRDALGLEGGKANDDGLSARLQDHRIAIVLLEGRDRRHTRIIASGEPRSR